MRIVIIGGNNIAEYLIKRFNYFHNKIVYITMDEQFANSINMKYGIAVYVGDGTLPAILEEAKIINFDLMITLYKKDEENLIACRLGKIMGVKRTLSTINQPNNANLLKALGVDSTISVADIISTVIEKNAFTQSIENLVPIEDGKALMIEVQVNENYAICGKLIKDIAMPQDALISCITRDSLDDEEKHTTKEVVIPKGDTTILANDHLIIVVLEQARQKAIKVVTEIV